MKRIGGDLFEKVMTYENVVTAWAKFNLNRPMELRKAFDPNIAHSILGQMMSDFKGIIGTPRKKTIREGGKDRELEIPSFGASIAMLALWNVCGPYIERRIHDQSFSSRKGMGGHLAAKKCERFVHTHAEDDAKYCWYFDIRKFYRHIDKRIVMDRIRTVFKDKRIIELFEIVVYSTETGLPIGYPFSHALANFYLVPLYFLIMSVKGITKAFVYMDNWNAFARFKKPLHKAVALASRWLAGVGCEFKSDWQIFPTAKRGVKLCGFVIFGNRKTRLYRGIWNRIMRTFERYKVRPTEHLFLSLMSRLGWLMAIHQEYNPIFKIKDGGYLWSRR